MANLKFSFLGPPRLERDGVPLEFDTRKIVALVAYLAATGESHTRETLMALLWPELEPSRARAVLRRNLSLLRKALDGEWLVVDGETISTDPDADLWVDVEQFRSLLGVWEEHGHPEAEVCPECLAALAEAAELYRGDFLAGFTLRDSVNFDEWQFFQTEGLRRELAWALERLVRGYSAQGAYERAIPHARRWLALDPLHEPAHRGLMQLYAQAGQRSAALRQYRQCVRVLEKELNLPPSEETTALYERIRAERARPSEPEAAIPAPPSPDAALPAFLTEEEVPTAVERPVFVARERELARLDGYLEAALVGQGQVVFVTGGPGRGKTALLHEFARQAMDAHPDLLVAGGNCNAYSGLGDPYLPFREVLGALAGDVEARWVAGAVTRDHAQRLWAALPVTVQALVNCGPSLIDNFLPGPALLFRARAVASENPDWLGQLEGLVGRGTSSYSGLEQRALFEQFNNVLRALAEAHPLLLTLDDVQWADAASISLLFHLGRRLEGLRILVVGAYRPEEVARGRDGKRHPLGEALSEFKRRFGDVWVDLARADESQGRRFVDAFLDTESNRLGEDFRRALFQRTGGHPLFTVEMLRAVQERGDLVQDDQGKWVETPALDWERLPARVEAVVEERVGRLEEGLREVLAVASVEGEHFTAQVVAQVQGIPEREMLRALSQELGTRHRLVREAGEARVGGRFLSRYQFVNALFQAYLRNTLSTGERRLLHGEIGGVLEEVFQGRTQEIAVQLAHHYAQAGDREKTVEYSLRAGDQARLAYANEEAISYFNRVLELLGELEPMVSGAEPLGESRKNWRLGALKGLGRVYYGMGKVAEAEEPFREAIALGREMGLAPRELARLYYWLAEVQWWQSCYDDMIRLGEEGLALLGADTESAEAALLNDVIAAAHYSRGNVERARECFRRTERFIQRLPYSPDLRVLFSRIILMHIEEKDVEGALRWRQALEEKAASHHDLIALAMVHHYEGSALHEMGDLHGAIARHQQGLELFTRIGDAKHKVPCLVDMAAAFLSLGDLQKAEEYVSRGLETAKAVGQKMYIASNYWRMGLIALCQGRWKEAVDAFQKALELFQEIGHPGEAWETYRLGRAYLAQEDRAKALKQFQKCATLLGPKELKRNPLGFSFLLSGLEAAYGDQPTFRAFCRRFREEHPGIGDLPFVQWYLKPTEVGASGQTSPHHDEFVDALSPAWVWQDPFDDCSFTVGDGLAIGAANGRDLWHINLSAPRVLRPVSGDLAVQTICGPISEQKPAIGGILLWRDKENYLRLDRGTRGSHEISFQGCLDNRDVIIGRGRLASDVSGQVFLRLERAGERVNAFCSADGVNWFTVGHVAFPVEGPIQVGLHAIGQIDRSVYHGAFPDGTAIRFESFQLWGLNR